MNEGSVPLDEVFKDDLSEQQLKPKSNTCVKSDLSCFWDDQKQNAQGYPEDPLVPEQGQKFAEPRQKVVSYAYYPVKKIHFPCHIIA